MAKNIWDKDTKKNWNMIPCWAVSHAPGWKIDWCEDKSVRVRMEDSKGKTAPDMKVPDMKCHFLTSDDKSVLIVEALGWMPSAGAQWVKMNGEVSFAVSRVEAEADPGNGKTGGGGFLSACIEGRWFGEGRQRRGRGGKDCGERVPGCPACRSGMEKR